MSTITELENQWHLQMAAEYPPGHRFAGQRLFNVDPKYARDVTALRVRIEQMKQAEASAPQISPDQIAQLKWLDRVATARDAEGKQLLFAMTTQGSALRKSLEQARQRVTDGKLLSQEDVKAIGQAASGAGAASYPETPAAQGRHLLPPASFDAAAHSASQPQITAQTAKV